MTDQPNTVGAINLPELLARVENDWDLLRELIAIFREDFPRYVSNLRHATEVSDTALVAESAHALKGMLANFSAVGAAHAAAQIEQLAKHGDQTALPAALAEFNRVTEGLVAEVEGLLAGANK